MNKKKKYIGLAVSAGVLASGALLYGTQTNNVYAGPEPVDPEIEKVSPTPAEEPSGTPLPFPQYFNEKEEEYEGTAMLYAGPEYFNNLTKENKYEIPYPSNYEENDDDNSMEEVYAGPEYYETDIHYPSNYEENDDDNVMEEVYAGPEYWE